MSATGRSQVRAENDFYATPAWCVKAIQHKLPQEGGWLEPCAGDGAIIRAGVHYWEAIEIDPTHYNALSAEYEAGRLASFRIADFLSVPIGDLGRYDLVLTNPPYRQAQDFIEKSLLIADQAVFLLRLNFLEGRKRAAFLRQYTPDVYVLSRRPSFTGKGTDATAYAWFSFYSTPRSQGRVEILQCG